MRARTVAGYAALSAVEDALCVGHANAAAALLGRRVNVARRQALLAVVAKPVVAARAAAAVRIVIAFAATDDAITGLAAIDAGQPVVQSSRPSGMPGQHSLVPFGCGQRLKNDRAHRAAASWSDDPYE